MNLPRGQQPSIFTNFAQMPCRSMSCSIRKVPCPHIKNGRVSHRHVRFGSKADMCSAKGHVRFTPNSDRESGHRQTVRSALPPKADVCSALAHVCFGPIADIGTSGAKKRMGPSPVLVLRAAERNQNANYEVQA